MNEQFNLKRKAFIKLFRNVNYFDLHEEKISLFSYTANVNRKTVDSSGIWNTRTFSVHLN